MSQDKDLYELLGISREADQQDIKKAFKNLAYKHHPDRNPEDKKPLSVPRAIQAKLGTHR